MVGWTQTLVRHYHLLSCLSLAGSGGRTVALGSTYLLQVHGRAVYATKAVQVNLAAASLNTNDCFVLVTPQETYVWLGKGSTGDEREMAKHIALQTNKDPEIVYEGQSAL